MERDGDYVALANGHDALVREPGQNLDAGAQALDYRSADEDGVDRSIAQDRHRQVRLERVELSAEGVPLDRHVE